MQVMKWSCSCDCAFELVSTSLLTLLSQTFMRVQPGGLVLGNLGQPSTDGRLARTS